MDEELIFLHDEQENSRTIYQQAIPSEPMEIGEEVFIKEVVAHVRDFQPGTGEEIARVKELVNQITDFSDITLQKLFEETNKDPETSKIKQSIIDKDWNLLRADIRKKNLSLSTELDLIFLDEKIFIPRSLREWILQVVHGDHESVPKMRVLTGRVYWPSKEKDLNKKVKQCITCFRSGKNLDSIISGYEVNRLPKFREVGEAVQIDFVGPVRKERKQKKYVVVAVDQFSKWVLQEFVILVQLRKP